MPVTHESFCSPRPSASASPYTVYVCHLLAKPKCRTHPDAVRIEVELLGRRQHDAVIEDSDGEDDDEITIVATGGDLA